MKKFKYVLVSLVAVLTFTAFGFSNSTNANAKSKYLTSYPKSIRGNWYVYTKHLGLTKIVIKKKSLSEIDHLEKGKSKSTTYTFGKPYSKKYIHFLDFGSSKEKYESLKHDKKMRIGATSFQANYKKLDGHQWIFNIVRYNQAVWPIAGYFNVRKINGQPILSYISKARQKLSGPIHFSKSVKEAYKIKGKKFTKSFRYHSHYNDYTDPNYYIVI